jgi:hypothetical protein
MRHGVVVRFDCGPRRHPSDISLSVGILRVFSEQYKWFEYKPLDSGNVRVPCFTRIWRRSFGALLASLVIAFAPRAVATHIPRYCGSRCSNDSLETRLPARVGCA